MLQLTLKEIAIIFREDMERKAPGYLITWFIEEELIPYDVFMESEWPDEDEVLDGFVWLN